MNPCQRCHHLDNPPGEEPCASCVDITEDNEVTFVNYERPGSAVLGNLPSEM